MLGAPATLALVRGTHRASATLVLLVVIAVAALTLAKPPRRWAARLATQLAGWPEASPALRRWARLGAALWMAQAALGALSGSGHWSAAPVAHMALALVAGSCSFGVGLAARQQGRRVEGTGLLSMTGLQFALAAVAAGSAAAPAWVLLHNIGAALGLALMLGLGRRAES